MSSTLSDALWGFPWFAVTCALFYATWNLSRCWYRHDTASFQIVSTIVMWSACIVGSVTMLGILGYVSGLSCLVTSSCVALGVWHLSRCSPVRDDLVGFAGAVKCGAKEAGEDPARSAAVVSPIANAEPRLGGLRIELWWGAVWGGLIAYWAGHVVVNGLLRFPSDFDTLMYHLPLMDHWLQSGSLYVPNCLHWSNPGGNEIIGLWMAAPFSGDFLAPLVNFPAALLLGLGAVELGATVGLSRPLAHLAGLASVGNFVVLKQLADAENDVAAAALFIASLTFALRYVDGRRSPDLILCSISLGLLAGIKYYALGYAMLSYGILVTAVATTRGARAGGGTAVVGLMGALSFGGYWYVRNAWVSGSPFYPMGTSPNNDVLGEVYPGIWGTTFLGNGHPDLLPLAVQAVWNMAGPVHLTAFFFLPITILWLVITGVASGSQTSHRRGIIRLAVGGSLLAAGVLIAITPMAVEDQPGSLNQIRGVGYAPVRYGLSFLTVAVVGMAVVLQDLSGWPCRPIVLFPTRLKMTASRSKFLLAFLSSVCRDLLPLAPLFLLAIGVTLQVFFPAHRSGRDALGTTLIAADGWLMGCNLYLCWVAWPGLLRKGVALPLALLAALVVAVCCGVLSNYWHRGFASYYEHQFGAPFLANMSAQDPAETRICVLDYQPYPYLGSARQFHLCQPIFVPSPSWLLRYMHENRVTMIIVRRIERPSPTDLDRFRWAFRWLMEHPTVFTFVGEGSTLVLFHVDALALSEMLENAPEPVRLEDLP